jgi:DNA-binding LytR/AlgR family response regulator
MDKSTFLKTFQRKSYPVDFSLDKLENLLNPDDFMRINRKYIVNMQAISNMFAYSRGRVKLNLDPPAENDADAIVSIERSANFKKWLNS